MSATLSEATGRPYGIQRVCQAWERSRSALYARQTREQQRHKGEEPARRGPTPTVSDATLLEAIQADLAVWINRPPTLASEDAPGTTIVTPDDPQHGVIRRSQPISDDRSITLVSSVESLQ